MTAPAATPFDHAAKWMRDGGYKAPEAIVLAWEQFPSLTDDELDQLEALAKELVAGELTKTEAAMKERAGELILFADGAEDAGQPELARRARIVARDVLDLLQTLHSERSARRAIQAERDRWQALHAKASG